MYKCFRKVRIIEGGSLSKTRLSYHQLLAKKKQEYDSFLKKCSCPNIKVHTDLQLIERCLAASVANEKSRKIKDHIESVSLNGKFSHVKLWKLKQKLCPRPQEPPMAKKDEKGNLITVPKSLKELYKRTYKDG